MSSRIMGPSLSVPVSERDHVRGPANATVTLVEYGDFECPFCGQAHAIVKDILDRFADELRFVFRHFPLAQIHPHAQRAAEASEAANAQGKFWPMHDMLYENQAALDDASLLQYAAALGLHANRFREELVGGVYASHIRDDFMNGIRSGVNGTPTFFINGLRHDGGWDSESLSMAIVAALDEQPARGKAAHRRPRH